ncbi:MAG: aldo/keto reductase [Thiolinea sp.]
MIPAVELNSQLSLSRLIYGVWRLGDDDNTATSHVRAKIDACLEQGMTSFDHADIYGDYSCEELFGRALAEAPELRDQMQLITKCDIMLLSDKYPERRVKYYDTSPAHITFSVDESLRYLHTDHLDLLLLHRPDPMMDAEATGRELDRLIDSGRVKAVGVSNFKPWDWDLLQSAMHNQLATNQIEMSVLTQDTFLDGTLAQQQRLGCKPMAWSPLAGGRLFGDDADAQRVKPILERIAGENDCGIDHVAIAWLLAHPAGILPIVGTNNLERIKDAHKALNVSIDRETWYELWTAAAGQEVP